MAQFPSIPDPARILRDAAKLQSALGGINPAKMAREFTELHSKLGAINPAKIAQDAAKMQSALGNINPAKIAMDAAKMHSMLGGINPAKMARDAAAVAFKLGISPASSTSSTENATMKKPKSADRSKAQVSQDLSEALSALTDQIRKAEKFLRKQPGADRAQVSLTHLELPTDNPGTVTYLETRRDGQGNCNIVVVYCDAQADMCIGTRELDEFPVSVRIDLCRLIPELIESAVVAQKYVVDDALTAAGEIEHALARHRDQAV